MSPALQTRRLRKVYPGTVALDDVSLSFEPGKVSALIGKNGAGKSTLVKILGGAIQPTSGEVLLRGDRVAFRSPREALARGIATVHQELSLVPDLSVAENIMLGRLPLRKTVVGPMVDRRALRDLAAAALAELGARIDPRTSAGRLSVAEQQLVEIARAMSFRPAVLMLDEPTSALAFAEVRRLFELIRGLADAGTAVIYITHRLQEIRDIADSVAVLRDGTLAGGIPVDQATPKTLVDLMFGGLMPATRTAAPPEAGKAVLTVRDLRVADRLAGVDLTLRAGEIVGIAGMLGSGRTELLMSIFGAVPMRAGEIRVGGVAVTSPSPQRMKQLGVGLTPEKRKEQGLVPAMSIRDNACLAALDRISRRGVISRAAQRRLVDENIRDLHIRAGNPSQPVSVLSGGNQQKVVIGNWLNTRPRVMLFDEPTRGIDVQAKQQIFQIIWELGRRGIACLFVSSELEELIEVCDRILVLRDGRIAAEVHPAETSLARLIELCMGE